MKRWFIIVVFASALPLAGGSGAAVSQIVPPNVVIPYGQLARVGNTPGVCAAVRVGIKVGSAPKQMASAIACYASKTGRPVIGAHVNLAMWVNGALLPAIGRWIRLKGIKDPYLNISDLWSPTVWGSPVIQISGDPIGLSRDQLLGKVKFRLSTLSTENRDVFAPGSARAGFACGVMVGGKGPDDFPPNTISCIPRQPKPAEVILGIIFWPPYGASNLEVYSQDTSCGCGGQTLYRP